MAEGKKQKRDSKGRLGEPSNDRKKRDEMMDKTLEDSYPASDPPSTIPDPDPEEDSEVA
jgi:hypothetical protein